MLAPPPAATAMTERITRWIHQRQHRHRYLLPLHHALAHVVGPAARRPEHWLHVPTDFRQHPETIQVDLPPHFHGCPPAILDYVEGVVLETLELSSDVPPVLTISGHRIPRPRRPFSPRSQASSRHKPSYSPSPLQASTLNAHGGERLIVFTEARSTYPIHVATAIDNAHFFLLALGQQLEFRRHIRSRAGGALFAAQIIIDDLDELAEGLERLWGQMNTSSEHHTSPALRALHQLLSDGPTFGLHVTDLFGRPHVTHAPQLAHAAAVLA